MKQLNIKINNIEGLDVIARATKESKSQEMASEVGNIVNLTVLTKEGNEIFETNPENYKLTQEIGGFPLILIKAEMELKGKSYTIQSRSNLNNVLNKIYKDNDDIFMPF